MPSVVVETTETDPFIIVSTWRCRHGREAYLDRVVETLLPSDAMVQHESGSDEYHFTHRFADRAGGERWLASPERAALHEALAEVAERVGTPERLSGLEAWFRGGAVPPRWKMWLASFLGAYPLVVLFQWQLAERLAGLPLLVRSAVFPLVLLSLMTWVMMPLITRLLHRWLAP